MNILFIEFRKGKSMPWNVWRPEWLRPDGPGMYETNGPGLTDIILDNTEFDIDTVASIKRVASIALNPLLLPATKYEPISI